MTLATTGGIPLADVHSESNPSPLDAPQQIQFPLGFVEFVLANGPQAVVTTISLYLEPGVQANTYYKYGPTPDNSTPHWYAFMFDGTTGKISPTTLNSTCRWTPRRR